jgi:anti-sigma-K factor RskA
MMCPAKNPIDQEILIEYCSGTLERNQLAQFEQHLAECADCARMVVAQKAVFESLDSWEPAEVAAGFDQRLFAKIAKENTEPFWHRWFNAFWKPALVTVAAGAALVFVTMVRIPSSSVPVRETPKQVRADSVDLDQMENTLEDLDLLTPSAETSRM